MNASIENSRIKNTFQWLVICNSDLPLFVVVHFGLHSHNISLKTTRMLLVLGREWEYGTMLSADGVMAPHNERDVENRM